MGNNLLQLSKAIHLVKFAGGLVYLPPRASRSYDKMQIELFTHYSQKQQKFIDRLLPDRMTYLPPWKKDEAHVLGPLHFAKEYEGVVIEGNFESDFTNSCQRYKEIHLHPNVIQSYNSPRLRNIFKEDIVPIIRHTLLPVDSRMDNHHPHVLTVHLRAGDVMDPVTTHPGFIQAPFSFLEKILKENHYSKVVICAENPSSPAAINPVLGALRTYCANHAIECVYDPRTPAEDIAIMLNAANLAITGWTSFSRSLALCSSSIQHIHLAKIARANELDVIEHAFRGDKSVRVQTYRFQNYFSHREEWTASDDQKRHLLTHPVSQVI